jgi:hypothetical protein
MIPEHLEVPIAGGLEFSLPRMTRVRQKFTVVREPDLAAAVKREIARPGIAATLKPGARIAVGFGSRGIAHIDRIAKALIAELKARGVEPFIFPAMGSHGAATAEGQRDVLAGYGITEATTGAPVLATMDTVVVGHLPDGTPVHVDRHAAEADGIILVNRIKPHTTFHGAHESGLVKMATIGMGKIIGASTLHRHGMDTFPELLPAAARIVLASRPLLFGVAVLENALDQTARIEAVAAGALFEREPQLLDEAKRMMARILIDDIDVLVIDEMGKNISGTGFDPNVTGRNGRNVAWQGTPFVRKIVVLSLTPETHGNATGIGRSDVTTMRVWRELDPGPTYANVITSGNLDGGGIPIVMNTDRDAVALAVKTVVRRKPLDARIVHIRNTLLLQEIEVSEPMLAELRARPGHFEITGTPAPFAFAADGSLEPIEKPREHAADVAV